jgi:hypothetical protein
MQEERNLRTSNKNRRENICSLVDQTTLSCHADCRQRVVTGYHPTRQVRRSESLDGRCSAWLELVFEDDKAKETEARFRLLATPWILKYIGFHITSKN